jgi:hypothetical protein
MLEASCSPPRKRLRVIEDPCAEVTVKCSEPVDTDLVAWIVREIDGRSAVGSLLKVED